MEVCISACFHEKSVGREVPGAQEFITKATKELQEAKAMRGERSPTPPSAAPSTDEGSELRACVNIPGLNIATSQELF